MLNDINLYLKVLNYYGTVHSLYDHPRQVLDNIWLIRLKMLSYTTYRKENS